MLGLLILLAAAPSSTPPSNGEVASARPLAEFNSCFIGTQERSGRAWAYLPTEHGGTFTDFGASGAAGSYWLQVRPAGATATRTRLRDSASSSATSAVVQAVEACR